MFRSPSGSPLGSPEFINQTSRDARPLMERALPHVKITREKSRCINFSSSHIFIVCVRQMSRKRKAFNYLAEHKFSKFMIIVIDPLSDMDESSSWWLVCIKVLSRNKALWQRLAVN